MVEDLKYLMDQDGFPGILPVEGRKYHPGYVTMMTAIGDKMGEGNVLTLLANAEARQRDNRRQEAAEDNAGNQVGGQTGTQVGTQAGTQVGTQAGTGQVGIQAGTGQAGGGQAVGQAVSQAARVTRSQTANASSGGRGERGGRGHGEVNVGGGVHVERAGRSLLSLYHN